MSASHIRVRPVDALLANVDKPLRKIARTIAKAHRADIDDLHQIALETALNLAPLYEPDRHATFLSFVHPRARGAMIDHALRERRESKRILAIQTGAVRLIQALRQADLHEEKRGARYFAAGGSLVALALIPDTPEDQVAEAELRRIVRERIERGLGELGDVDRAIVEMVAIEERSIADVARALGVAYHDVWRRYGRAVERLGRGLGALRSLSGERSSVARRSEAVRRAALRSAAA